MKKRISALLLALAPTGFARQDYTRTFDKSVNVQPGASVRVEHKFGDVTVRAVPGQSVTIHADIRASAPDEQQAREFAEHVEILVEQSSGVSIRTRYPETPRSFFGMRNVSFSVHYDITVPGNSPLSIRNAFGRVQVSGLKAGSDIVNSNGDLILRDGAGTQRLENAFGGIEILNNHGDSNIQTSNGRVKASAIAGRLTVRDRFANVTVDRVANGFDINNGNGSVEVTNSSGSGEIRSTFGNITVSNLKGDLIANTTNAAIEAEHIAGPAELNTTFGAVRFLDIGQGLKIRANNSRVEGNGVRGPLTIVNSFGPVTARSIGGEVQVESGNGSVTLEQIGGPAGIRTSFGAVETNNINGQLTVRNANGSVKASRVKGVHITTSFGAVILDDIAGPIQIENQNGAVDAASSLRGSCQPVHILTSFSTLRIHLPSDASYHVSAHTSFGKISTDFPLSVSGSLSSDNLDGTIGGGHCEMKLSDANGAIEILKGGSAQSE